MFDGERLTEKTPYTIKGVTVGTSHDIRVELARHTPYVDKIDIPRSGGAVPVMALLKPVTGKLVINSQPGGAEIRLDGVVKGFTPATLLELPVDPGMKLELRLKDYQPVVQDLSWPSDGKISLDIKLQR
ncbi:MAG: PEGA domain-containing protein [Myxococcota bacterium]|nr:PEGA domain-containing protein [Myxococcota bacterium]